MEIRNRLHIDLRPGQNLFFTSDLHFGHRNVLKFCNRPWEDEKQMSKGLIENWNKIVTNNDIVVSLGDFSWWDSNTEIKKLLSQLSGEKIYLVPGNHDTDKGYRELPERVELLGSVVQVWISGLWADKPNKSLEVTLCHYPLATWPHKHNGALQFFGHIHSGMNTEHSVDIVGEDLNIVKSQQVDVGCDNWGYYPVEIKNLIGYLENFKVA